ncbi:MAG: cation diffusion facilitator family transporter [Phycisphaerales bacterium]|nr:cation diffusion facilitator family transporter [Phycisphaerales bacterium]
MSAHSHDQAPGDAGGRRLGIAVAINLLLTAAQIIGGVLAGSLSLVADALHNFSDAAGLLLALIARRISKRPADEDRTFGYGRASVVGGLINLTSIIVIAGYLLIEAITRAFERPEVDGWIVVIVAGIALAVDVATAVLTYAMSKSSINIKAAFLHNLADALASVVVIITGTLIILFDWYWTDLVATIGISIYIVWMSVPPLKRCIRILMQSTPEDVDVRAVADAIASCEGVEGVFHLHVWMIDEHTRSVEVRVNVDDRRISELAPLRLQIEELLAESFDAAHTTIEFVNGSAADRPLIARH